VLGPWLCNQGPCMPISPPHCVHMYKHASHLGLLCHQLLVMAGWPEQHKVVNGSCCYLSLACRVPFVQRILHERRAASQSGQPGTDATPSKHVSLSHQPSPVPSPRSPSRASLVPPSGFTTPGRLSRSPSMCPTPKSPGHRLSVLPTSTSRCAFALMAVHLSSDRML